MLEKKTTTIDGLSIESTQLPAIRAHQLFWKLGKVAPYVLARIDVSQFKWDGEFTQLAPAILELFGRLSVEESTALIREILCATTVMVDGKAIAVSSDAMIDLVFSGRLGALYGTVAFVVMVNYGDFIRGALASQASAPEETDKANG